MPKSAGAPRGGGVLGGPLGSNPRHQLAPLIRAINSRHQLVLASHRAHSHSRHQIAPVVGERALRTPWFDGQRALRTPPVDVPRALRTPWFDAHSAGQLVRSTRARAVKSTRAVNSCGQLARSTLAVNSGGPRVVNSGGQLGAVNSCGRLVRSTRAVNSGGQVGRSTRVVKPFSFCVRWSVVVRSISCENV